MSKVYDVNNVFNKIINGEIPTELLIESKYTIAFRDINPSYDLHILVIPRGHYTNYSDFIKNASDNEIIDFNKTMSNLIDELDIEEEGYRIVSNTNDNAGQEIYHYHAHILGGEKLNHL